MLVQLFYYSKLFPNKWLFLDECQRKSTIFIAPSLSSSSPFLHSYFYFFVPFLLVEPENCQKHLKHSLSWLWPKRCWPRFYLLEIAYLLFILLQSRPCIFNHLKCLHLWLGFVQTFKGFIFLLERGVKWDLDGNLAHPTLCFQVTY